MRRSLYLDTSALVKLYIDEPGSDWVQEQTANFDELLLTPLQETELRNAILAAGGRDIISPESMQETLQNLEMDIREGCYERVHPDWLLVWHRTDRIAEAHTTTILCRTLDILHAAVAESLKVDLLITGDERQFTLCQAVGIASQRMPS